MNGMLQTCFFFGYMGICCFGLFLMLGTVGWRVSTCPSPFTCALASSDICHMISVDECSMLICCCCCLRRHPWPSFDTS